ncbi:MAG TPA: PEP-CTERM sorting domain-containing protein [Candidatus Brocadiales bacterium]|nr:PEP-CTERM sorting domain-containing protein [Candidatus Brocadiales bacterium]
MWLKDANLAATSGYCLTPGNCLDSNGMMTWDQVNAWINSLNSSNYLGYNDWRLPVTLPVDGSSYNWDWSYDGSTDRGWNITSLNSEMSYLFYVELGNLGEYDTNGNPQPGYEIKNSGPFVNIVNINSPTLAYYDGWYWSGTEVGPPPYDAVGFNFGLGRQYGGYYPGYGDHGWAVRDCESCTAVPEPSTFILLASGIGTLLAGRKLFIGRINPR